MVAVICAAAFCAAFGAAGAVAGAGARVLLARMRRGTHVGPPGCEVAVALGWAAAGGAWAAGAVPGEWLPVLLALAWFGVTAGVVDLRHRRLPDLLTLPALPVALLLLLPLGPSTFWRAALGALLVAGVHAAMHLASPSALGAGDVKLAAPLGAVVAAVSWPALLLAAVVAALCTAVAGLVLAARLRGVRAAVPHGPSMLLATAIVTVTAALESGAG